MVTYSGAITLASFSSLTVFQRDTQTGDPAGAWTTKYGRGWSSIQLALTPTAAFQQLEYRVRALSAPDGAPALDWTVCSSAQPAGATTAMIQIPAASEWFLVDVRANGDSSSIETTSPFGVGEVIAASGQSLASDFWSTIATGDTTSLAAAGVTASPYGVCYAAWDGNPPPAAGTAWVLPNDTSAFRSTFCTEFLRLAVLGSGVNCALVGYSWSGEPIASWRSDGSGPKNAWSPLITTLDNAVGNGGRIGTLIWMHGHNDARIAQAGIDGDELTASSYLASLATLIANLSSRYNGRSFRRILSSIPAIGNNWIVTYPKFDPSYIEQVRSAHQQFAANDSLTLGHVDGLDTALWTDQTHPSQLGNITFARHFYRAFMAGIDAAAYRSGDSGPYLTGAASRAAGSPQIYINVAHTGGTALTCNGGSAGAATQFQVYKSGSRLSSDQFAVQGADFPDRNTIVLTLSTAPADNQSVDVWYRLPPDNSPALLAVNQIYDNNAAGYAADGLATGRQLAMRASPVTVPAPIGPHALLLAPGVLLDVGLGRTALTS